MTTGDTLPTEQGGRPNGSVRRLLLRGSVYTVGSLVQAGSAVLVLPALTRLLGPEDFGTVATSLIVGAIVTFLAPFGLPSAILRGYFRGDRGPSDVHTLLMWSLLLAIIVAGVVHLAGPLWIQVFSSAGYGGAYELAVWLAVPAAVLAAAQAYLTAADRAEQFIALTIFADVGGTIVGLAVVASGAGPTGYLAGLAGTKAVAALVAMVFGRARLRALLDLQTLRWGLAIGFPTVPHQVSNYLLAASDRIVIEHFRGLAAAGRYQAAYMIGSLGVVLMVALNKAWAPMIYGAAETQRWTLHATTTAAVYRLGALLAGGLALAAPIAIFVVTPTSFEHDELAPIVAVLALGLLPFVTYVANVIVIFQANRTRVLLAATPAAAAFNIASNVVAVPAFGLMGAAAVTVASNGVLAWLIRRSASRMAVVPWVRGAAVRAWALAATLSGTAIVLPPSGIAFAIRVLLIVGVCAAFIREFRNLVTSD